MKFTTPIVLLAALFVGSASAAAATTPGTLGQEGENGCYWNGAVPFCFDSGCPDGYVEMDRDTDGCVMAGGV